MVSEYPLVSEEFVLLDNALATPAERLPIGQDLFATLCGEIDY
jgi:hypothetical protein